MENQEVREQLAQIVRQHGQSIAEDPPKLQGLLRDLVGQHRREVNILMQAVRVNVPEELLRSSGPTSLTAERLASKLQEDTGLSPDAAQWAVSTWGNALGISVEFEEAMPAPDFEPQAAAPVSDMPARPQVTTPAPPPVASNPPYSNPQVSTPPPAQAPPMQAWQQPAYAPPPFAAKKGMSGGLIATLVVCVLVAIGGGVWALTHKSDIVKNDPPSPTTSSTTSPTGGPSESPTPTETQTAFPTFSTPPSPSPGGIVEGGLYTDAGGLFSFVPPTGWAMTSDPKDGSVLWSDTDNPSIEAKMDLRSAENTSSLSLAALAAATEAELKDKMGYETTKPASEMHLGGEKGKLLYGTINGADGKKEMAMVIALHANKAVIVTMGTNAGKLKDVASVLDKSLDSWKWK